MQHIIVGAGPAGVIAAETLRKKNHTDSITIIGDESYPAYSRMAIPYFLAGEVAQDGTYLRHSENHFDALNINVLADSVTQIKVDDQSVALKSGANLSYDRLLLATGAHAIRPPISGMDSGRVHNCWTLNDAHGLLNQVKADDRVVLLGAGFIGCIVLQALVSMKLKITVVELADRMLARMMDEPGGRMIKSWCEGKGVEVRTAAKAVGVTDNGSELAIDLDDGSTIVADHLVCAAGVKPNTGYLEGSGITIDQGIVVNSHLRTNVENIYAAGDVAQGPDRSTGKNEVHAIQPTASEHGRIAASQMAGDATPYGGSLSMNVLNTLGLITSSFGIWDGVEDGERAQVEDSQHNRYLRLEFEDDILIGALAIGLTEHVGVLRGLIQTRVKLGNWKDQLLKDPSRVMNAYLAKVQGVRSVNQPAG